MGGKRTPAEPRVSRGPTIPSSNISTMTDSQVCKWERAESTTYEHPRNLYVNAETCRDLKMEAGRWLSQTGPL